MDSYSREILIVLLAVGGIALCIASHRIISWRIARAQQNRDRLLEAMLAALRWPLAIMIVSFAIWLFVDIAWQDMGNRLRLSLNKVAALGAIASGILFLVLLIRRIPELLVETAGSAIRDEARRRRAFRAASAISRILTILVVALGVLTGLALLGVNVTGILAFGGIGSIIVGLAARDLLSNLFGGLIIYLDRPFDKGDWIICPSENIEGIVEHIGWRITRVRTFKKHLLYVPNSIFATHPVENPSHMTHRRIYETIGIRYDDAGKMRDIIRDTKSMLRRHPEIDSGQTLIVNFDKFAPSSLDFFIYTFTKTTDWVKYHEVKQDVLLKSIDLILRHGAECAFPTSTVLLQNTSIPPQETPPDSRP